MAIFNGNSRYSSDFQAIIDRSIAFASLPLTQLQQSKLKLEDEVKALQSIDAKASALQTSLGGFESSLAASAYSAGTTDPDVVKATASEGALTGEYSVEVLSLGAYATTMSAAGTPKITDPATMRISASATFTLEIDTDLDDAGNALTTKTITPDGTSLQDLADKINEEAGSNVRATVVNFGSAADPDYRLSLQSKTLGNAGIRLLDGGSNLMTGGGSAGSKAQYKLNGVTLSSTTRTAEIAPKLTIDLLSESAAGHSETITVTKSFSALRNSLTSFVSNFNVLITELDTARTGALKGQSVVSSINATLRRTGGFDAGTGDLESLADIGVLFGKDGRLYLDSAIFDEATKESSLDDLKTLIGAPTTGGFIKNATEAMNSLEDTTRGVITGAITSTQASIKVQEQRMEVENARISDMEKALQDKLYAADGLIAMLEQQVSYFEGMWSAMKQASEQYS